MCSVRHRPMPSAPNSRAVCASSGVSALVRTPRRAQLVGPAEHGLELLGHLGLDERHVVGGDRRRSCRRWRSGRPRSSAVAVHAHRRPRARSISRSDAPAHAGHAHPARDQRGVRRLAALAREDALRAAWKPATSSASVNGRTRMTSRPSSAAATASSAVKTISPLRRARRRRHAAGEHLVLGVGVERRVQQRVERLGVDRRQRLAPCRAAPRRRRRPRSAPPPAPGAWRCASAACRGAPPRP